MSEAMTINDIINQLGSLRASSAEFAKSDPENEIWQAERDRSGHPIPGQAQSRSGGNRRHRA